MLNNLKNQSEKFSDYFTVDSSGKLVCSTSETYFPAISTDTITATTQVISNVVISNYSVNGEVSATGDVNAFISSGSPISLKNVSDLLTITTNSRLNSVEAVNSTQNSRLDAIDILNATQNSRLNSVESVNSTQNSRLNNLENLTTGTSNLVIDVSDIKNKVQNIVDVDSTKTTFKERLNMRDVDGNIRVVLDANGTSNANTVLYTTPGQGVESGYLNVQSINVKDSLGNNKINFNGNTSQTFLVSGDGRFTDSLTVEDNLTVHGNASLNTLTIFNSINPFTVKNATDTANLLAVNPATNEILIGDATQQSSIRFPYSDATITYNSINFPSATFSNANILSNLNTSNISANGSLNVSGTTNLKNLNINGNLNVYGGSITSQSVINQFTSMSIIMNPAGSVPGLSVTQGGGTNAIFEVVDSDSNIKFQINQDCDLSINNGHFLVDSATGDLTTLGGIQTSGNVVVGSGQNKIQLRQNTGVIDCVDIHSATFPSGLNTAISGKQDKFNGTTSQYIRGDASLATFPTIPSGTMANLNIVNNKCIYVSASSGNDSNNGQSEQNAVATIQQAVNLVDGSGWQIAIFPGTYSENVSIGNTKTNLSILGVNRESGGIINCTGTWTISHTTSSIRLYGLALATLNHNSTGSLYIEGCKVNITLSSSSSGYLQVYNSDLQGGSLTGTVNITGSGTKVFGNGSAMGFLTINNASAIVSLNNNLTSSPITLTTGVLGIGNSVVYSATLTGNSITSSSGSTLILDNTTLLTPSGTPARLSIASGANYSFRKVFFDKTNSTISGTRVSQNLVSDAIDVNSLTSNNINTGALCINKVSPSTGSVVDLSLANSSMIIPKGTIAERPTPISGMIRYNATTNAFEGASGSGPSWQSLGGIQNAYSTITANNIGFSAIGQDNFTFDAGSGISFDTSGDKTCIISNNRNQWNNIAISGQTTLNPTSTATTLNLVAGTGMSILTNNSTKSITFNASGGGNFNPTINNVALYDMLSYNDNVWTNLVPLRNVPTFTVSGNTATLASVNHVFNISSSTYDWQLSTNSNFNSPIVDDNTASPSRDFQAFVTGGVVYYVRIRVVSNWLSKKTQWFSSSFTAVGLPLNWTNRTPQNTLTVTGWLSDGSWNSITQNPNNFVGVDVNNNNSSGSSRPPVSVNPWYSNGNTVVNGSLTENNMTLMVNNTNVNESSYLSIANSALGYGCIIFDLGSTFFLSSGCIIRAVYNIAGGWGNIVYANGLCVEYYDTVTGWVEVAQYPTISQVSEMQNFYTLSFGGAYQSRFWRVRNKTSLYTAISGFRLLN